jgi:FKBP-type peptidyl-prolyl cis-trans isomerase
MKKLLLTGCLLLAVMALHARAIQEDVKKADEKAKVSYAFGMVIGSDLEGAGVELDYAAFAEGLRAKVENGERPFSDDEAMEIAQGALQKAMEKKAQENREKEAQFWAENNNRPEIRSTPSGLQYEVLTGTEGEKPSPGDMVKVHYEGALTDGTVFDSSYARNEPAEFGLDWVIPGWAEGIQLMSIGSKYRLFIPSDLAYGAEGAARVIPPYATLVFTVELLEIIKAEPDAPGETEDAGDSD